MNTIDTMARAVFARAVGWRASKLVEQHGPVRRVSHLGALLITLVLAAFSAVPASAAIAYVQGGSGAGVVATSRTVTYPSSQSAGTLNVVIVAYAAGAAVTAVTDSAGDTYTLAGSTTANGGVQAVYYAKNVAAAGTNVVTVTFGSST